MPAATSRVLSTAPPPQRSVYRWVAAGPFVILAAAAALLAASWSRIPPRFVVHWNASGVPNGWAHRSFWGVFGMLLIPAVFCLLTLFLGHATLHWAEHPQGVTSPEHRRRAAWTLLTCSYLLAVIFSAAALLPLRRAAGHLPKAWIVLPALLIPLAVAILIARAWKSHPARRPSAPSAEPAAQGHWIAGTLYYNPDDPRILVPKLFGYGITFNMAHPRAWLLLGALGAAITLALLLAGTSH